MRKLIHNGHKRLSALVLFMGLGVNHLNAFPVIDPTNLIQNTITALQEVASYSKQISSWIRTIQEFEKHATEFTNELLGLDDMLGDIKNISKDVSDIYKAKEDIEQFNKEILSDPKGFLDGKYKKYTDNYNLYDKCSGFSGDAFNICVRDKINYAAGIKQHSDYGNVIHKLRKQLDKQIKDFDKAKSQKDRENAALAIRATQSEIQKAQSLNELESIEYRNNARIVAEQKAELFRKSMNVRYSVAEKYKNVGKRG